MRYLGAFGFGYDATGWQYQPGHLHDPDPPFELEDKPFAGERLVTATAKLEPTYYRALTGQVATTARGFLGFRNLVALDNFTDTNGTALTAHTPDISPYGTWSLTYDPTTTGDPTIQSNRLRSISACAVVAQMDGTSGILYDLPWWYEAVLYRNATSGATDDVNGIAAWCTSSGFYSGGADAWQFGWNELNDYWELRRLYGGVSQSVLTDGTTNVFTGTGQTRTIRMRVTGSAGNITVLCEVDGTQIFNHNETTFYMDENPWGVCFGGDQDVLIDSFQGYDDALRLSGQKLTTTAGDINLPKLVGQVATTTAGTLTGSTGSETSVALTGLAATSDDGIITPDTTTVVVELTGLAATTNDGTVDRYFGPGTAYSFNPRVAWTYYTDASDQNPGNIGTQFLPWAGILHGAGNYASENTQLLFPRSGWQRVSQITEETFPWTANPKWTSSDNSGMAIDNTTNPFLIGSHFPRGFAGSQDPGPRYNTIYSKGGWIAISANGYIWSAVERIYDKMGSVDVFLAPHPGEVASPNYYNGPELFTGRAQGATENLNGDHQRQKYTNVAPMGLYPLSESEVLGFYPQIIDGRISGRFADLVGLRATVTFDPPTAAVSGGDVGLTGLVATTNYNTFSIDGYREGALTGQDAVTAQGKLYSRDANVVPAFRRLKNGVWSDPVIAESFTGASRVWTRSHYMTVVPTGYNDLIYVAYYSEGLASVGPKIGLLVMDAASGTVTSNTLYDIAATPFTRFGEGDSPFGETVDLQWRPWGPHRTVALTHKLGSGTHVTQFLLCGQVVHISWTSGARTTPTVTIKDGVSLGSNIAVYPAWESLEVRGDKVYHVVPAGNNAFGFGGTYDGGVGTLYVNDATGTGSTWDTPTLSVSESGTKDTARDYVAFYGGYGGGRKTWWYLSWWESNFSVTEEGNDTGWFDAWYQQSQGHSVSATAYLGRVTTSVVPTVPLTGLRAETRTDHIGLFPLVDGDKVARLTDKGKRLITRTPSGKDFLPYDEFFVDNFTGSGNLLSHTADTGQSWEDWGQEQFVLDGSGSVYCSATTWGNYVAAFPTMTPPGNDYCVNAKFSGVRAVTVTITGVINEGVGARVKNSQGYWFGYNYAENKWYLSKGRPDLIDVALPEYDWPGTLAEANVAQFSIEVTGTSPTRVRCFINDVQVIDYTDTGDQYFDGAPGICSVLGNNNRHYIDYINAGVHDAQALILVGQRATTAQGAIDFGLVGQVATTAQGTLTPDLTTYVALTGLAATTAKGDFYWFPTGLAATTAAGTIVGEIGGVPVSIGLIHGHIDTFIGIITIPIVEAPGLRAVTAQGALGLAVDQAPVQTGLVATATQGVIAPEVATPVLGRVATGAVGQPVPQIAAPAWSWGLHSDALAGSLGRFAEDLAQLVGNAATATQGVITPVVQEDSLPLGQAATTANGLLTPVVEIAVVGNRLTMNQGVTSVALTYEIVGLAAATQQGLISVYEELFLVGQSAAMAQGVVTHQNGGNVDAQGLQMRIYLGSVSDTFKKPSDGLLLWALQQPDELFAQEAPDEENPVVAPNE